MANIRVSKFRNVYGQAARRDETYSDLQVYTSPCTEYNNCKANSSFLGVAWDVSGGGSFAVLPITARGRFDTNVFPLFSAHTAPVVDLDFAPYDDFLVASAAEDCQLMIWRIPSYFADHDQSAGAAKPGKPATAAGPAAAPVLVIPGAQDRRMCNVLFHPTASGVVATVGDNSLRIWDIESNNAGTPVTEPRLQAAPSKDGITSFAFDYAGNHFATASRDRMLRVYDARAPQTGSTIETLAHDGSRAVRLVYAGDSHRVVTTGASKTSERQVHVFDLRNPTAPVAKAQLDRAPGIIVPYFDKETGLLFLAGKGDSSVSFYELTSSADSDAAGTTLQQHQLHRLGEYRGQESHKSCAFIPKRGCQTSTNEIARCFRVHAKHVEPVSFIVPRRNMGYSEDLYPNCPTGEPALNAQAFFAGQTVDGPVLGKMPETAAGPMSRTSSVRDVSAGGSPLQQPLSASLQQGQQIVATADIEAKDARIAELEAKVAELTAELEGLKTASA